jgi:hypothetical protein
VPPPPPPPPPPTTATFRLEKMQTPLRLLAKLLIEFSHLPLCPIRFSCGLSYGLFFAVPPLSPRWRSFTAGMFVGCSQMQLPAAALAASAMRTSTRRGGCSSCALLPTKCSDIPITPPSASCHLLHPPSPSPPATPTPTAPRTHWPHTRNCTSA